MRSITNVKWYPMATTLIGALKGCSDGLGCRHSASWIFGASGYAFLLNLDRTFCASHPTLWNMDGMHQKCRNLGLALTRIAYWDKKSPQDAWRAIREGIDQGRPGIAFQLKAPEFYVVYGYDDVGYYFSGPGAEDGAGPYGWEQLGSDLGLWSYVAAPCKVQGNEKTVFDALHFALELNDDPTKWTWQGKQDARRTGIAAYKLWLEALGDVPHDAALQENWGFWYNVKIWTECRRHAVLFLKEARGMLPALTDDWDDMTRAYEKTADSFIEIGKLGQDRNARRGTGHDRILVESIGQHVARAMRSEDSGLASMARICRRGRTTYRRLEK